MIRRLFAAAVILTVVVVTGLLMARSPESGEPRPVPELATRAAGHIMEAPLVFEPNRGQAEAGAQFVSRGSGYELRLDASGASLTLAHAGGKDTVRLALRDGAATRPLEPEQVAATKVNYMAGNDRAKWIQDLPTYARVRYPSVYPGIDLLFYGKQQKFEYDFIVDRGADPSRIRVVYSGADRLALGAHGNLVLAIGDRQIEQARPIAYQDINGTRRHVDASFRLSGPSEVAFALGAYDVNHPLVIDPYFAWGGYVANTSGLDEIGGVAVTSQGEVVVAATVQLDVTGEGHIKLLKFAADGALMAATTFMNGEAADVAVDYEDNIYVTGTTTDWDFPTTRNALLPEQPVMQVLGFIALPFMSGGVNGFLTRFTPDLSMVTYSTYLGGNGDIGTFGAPIPGAGFVLKKVAAIKLRWTISPGHTNATALAIRPGTHHAYVVGWTESGGFPTTDTAVQSDGPTSIVFLDKRSAFLAVIDTSAPDPDVAIWGVPNTESMLYGTYLGSRCADEATAVAVAVNGDALITGKTTARNFSWSDSFFCGQMPITSNNARMNGQGFLMRLAAPNRAQAETMVYGTYLAGAGLAVAPGPAGANGNQVGADVFQLYDNPEPFRDVVQLIRASYHGAQPMRLDDLGGLARAGTSAGIATLIGADGHPLTHVLYLGSIDENGNDLTGVLRMDVSSGQPEWSTVGSVQGRVGGIAATAHAAYLGVNTTNTTIHGASNEGAGRGDGYLTRWEFDSDPPPPPPDPLNRIDVVVPGPIVTRAESADGRTVFFHAGATYVLDGSTLPITCDSPSGSIFRIGISTVACWATTDGGVLGVARFTVTVTDYATWRQMPQSQLVEATWPTGALAWFAPEPLAADFLTPIVPTTCTPASGTLFAIGDTVVNCRASDAAGPGGETLNQPLALLTTSFVVTVADTTGPVMAATQDRYVVTAPNADHAAVAYDTPAAIDAVDGAVSVTCAPASGSAFPLGFTTVTCSAADARGHSSSRSFGVFVAEFVDYVPPVIAGLPQLPPTSDNETRPPTLATMVSLEGGAVSYALFLASSYTGCEAWQAGYVSRNGTESIPHCMVVTAEDALDGARPVTCHTNYQSPDTSVTIAAAAQPLLFSEPLPREGFPSAIPNVTCRAADINGNTAVGEFAVGFSDLRSPILSAVPSNISVAAGPDGLAWVTFTTPTAVDPVADNAPLAVTCVWDRGELYEQGNSYQGAFPLGENYVTCQSAPGRFTRQTLAQFTVAVHEGPPQPAIRAFIQEATTASPSTATFTFSAHTWVGDPENGMYLSDPIPGVPMVCAFDGSAFVPCQSPIAFANLVGDLHEFRVMTADSPSPDFAARYGWMVERPDYVPPSLAMPADEVREATGPGTPVSFDVTATDPTDGDRDVVCAPASGFAFPVGSTIVTCHATDQWGNDASGEFVVTVLDTTPPVMQPMSQLAVPATDASGAHVALSPPAHATDLVDGAVAVVCVTPGGSQFPLGLSAVRCSAVDARGNRSIGGFFVHVIDDVAPVVTVPADITTLATSAAGAVVTFAASATDNIGVADPVGCNPLSGATFAPGVTTVTCMARDLALNLSAPTMFTVTVTKPGKGEKPPKVTAPKNMKVEATGPSGTVVTFAATALDPVQGALPVSCVPQSGSLFPLGATTVTCSAVNTAGKRDDDTFIVNVRDTVAPTIVSVVTSATVLPTTDQAVPIAIAVVATDLVDAAPVCLILRVHGGGKDLDNDGVIDWTITGPLTLNVEAIARKHKDRTYKITIRCSDASGNRSKEKTAVVVSHQ